MHDLLNSFRNAAIVIGRGGDDPVDEGVMRRVASNLFPLFKPRELDDWCADGETLIGQHTMPRG